MTVFYFHSGSGNHGCEAIVKTLIDILKIKPTLYSFNHWEDYKFDIDKIVDIKRHDNIIGDIAISIGGDNYCYPGSLPILEQYNRDLKGQGTKTCLIGCSIDRDTIIKCQEDLKRYDLITARESLTQQALKEIGVNAPLIPDSAFILNKEEVKWDDNGKEWIGINASNFVSDDVSRKNYQELIQYIMNNTKYNVLLIPHVEQKYNNDYPMLQELYINNGRMRWAEGNANQLKGYISKCKMVVTARTHVSVASYSLCIPALVLGYSIKSHGIALDLFDTSEGYVVPKDSLKTPYELKNGFIWLDNNYSAIKKRLEEIMPEYKNKCYRLRELYESLCSKE